MDLKVARRVARLSQKQLARRAGVDHSAISLIENDHRQYQKTAYATIVNIARALHVAPELLFPVAPVGRRRESARV